MIDWRQLPDCYVNDTGPVLEFPVLDFDEYTARDNTNYAAYLSFWYNNADPHSTWMMKQITGNPAVWRYFYHGDEYPLVGTVNIQATFVMIEWGTNTNGRGYVTQLSEIMQRRVLARPT